MSKSYEKNAERVNNERVASEQWKQWVAEGRAPAIIDTGKASRNEAQSAAIFNQLAQQDKMIKQYYKLATGNEADRNTIKQFVEYADDPALLTAAIGKAASQMGPSGSYNETINAAIREKMGRDATEAEKTYFGKQMEAGNIDLYGLGSFLEGTNEYQTKVADAARTKLAGELGGVDQQYLDKVSKELSARYAAQGRQGAGAFGSALIEAGKDLATQRTGYLAGLGYQDAQRGLGNLRADYEAQLARQYANQQSGLALGQESRSRYYSNQDFARQQAAAERLARLQQGNKGSFFQQIAPGLVQGAFTLGGAYLGNPSLGYMAGQGASQRMAPQTPYSGSMYNSNTRLNLYNPY